jgi:hypothetical protein
MAPMGFEAYMEYVLITTVWHSPKHPSPVPGRSRQHKTTQDKHFKDDSEHESVDN